jgi:hypothetical protein
MQRCSTASEHRGEDVYVHQVPRVMDVARTVRPAARENSIPTTCYMAA